MTRKWYSSSTQRHWWLALSLLLCGVLSGGCGTLRKVALATAVGPALNEAAQEIETEANWETFRQALPSNLKMIEGLLHLSPHNEDLMAQALKAHSAYAFGVWETLWLQTTAPEQEREQYRRLALKHYAKAIHWGLSYLKENGTSHDQLQQAQREGTLTKALNNALGDEQGMEVGFFLAQSMGGYGNLERTSPMVLAQLPLVKELFDWVCRMQPNFRHGVCSLFYGAWDAGRPAMVGGNPAKGREVFLKAISQYPENYLIRIAYLRFSVIPRQDSQAYREQKAFLRQAFRKWEERFRWPPHNPQYYRDSRNLYNAIAQKQFQILMENHNEMDD